MTDYSIPNLRREYQSKPFLESDLKSSPVEQFHDWFTTAVDAKLDLPDACCIATADTNGVPSARMVLLKHYDEEGFVFYTSYDSRKGKEIAANPKGSLVFWWAAFDRQIRIEGNLEKTDVKNSQTYFHTRPKGAQFSAAATTQSIAVTDRKELEAQRQGLEEKVGDGEVPCPDNWGGYRLVPNQFEFWQGREDRLHDRLCYVKKDGGWNIVRLAP